MKIDALNIVNKFTAAPQQKLLKDKAFPIYLMNYQSANVIATFDPAPNKVTNLKYMHPYPKSKPVHS